MRPPQITGGNVPTRNRTAHHVAGFNEAPADHGGERPGSDGQYAGAPAASMRPPQITGGNSIFQDMEALNILLQ